MTLLSQVLTAQCTTVAYTSPYPSATFTPTCTGVAQNVGGVTNCYAGEYSNVALTSGTTYRFGSSIATDYLTITDNAGVVKAAGLQPLIYRAVATATHRFYTHSSGPATCGTAAVNRARTILCGSPTPTCTNVVYSSPYPSATFTPTCSGSAQNVGGVTNCYAGEYSNVALTAGTTYTFGSSIASDYLTITDNGGIVLASGPVPVVYVAQATATHRFYTHTNGPATCGTAAVNRTRTISCAGAAFNPCSPTIAAAACGTTQVASFTTTNAGWNPFSCLFNTPGQERVYTYTPPTTGIYSLTTTATSGINYVDYFWKLASGGCSSSGWTCIDDVNGALTFGSMSWTAGVPVLILLDAETSGTFTQTWRINCPSPPPANDACASAINVSAYPYTSAVVSNASATNDFTTSTCDGPYKNVWWRVSGVCGTMTATTCVTGTNFDTEIAVFSGACGTLTQVACNDDATCAINSLYSTATWTATQGTFYYISVGSYFSGGATGNLVLNVTVTDSDGDGIGNTCDNCPSISNATQTNTDGDASGDACDADDDNDGITDGSDPSPLNPNICGDADGDGCDDCSIGTDGFGPMADNTPANDGLDTDGDGLCDFGDADDDNDGVLDGPDTADLDPNQCADADGDGCDDCAVGTDDFGPLADNTPANDGTDTDGDGICDFGDNCDNDINPLQTNSDADPLGDACDICPTVTNGNPGDPCDDGDNNTVLDVLGASPACGCAGVTCTTDLDFVYQAEGADDLDWFIYEQVTDILVQTGGGPIIGNGSEATCLPDGCYYLVVTDGGGDGIVNGGYMLKINSAARLIDNLYGTFGEGGFTSGATSVIDGNEGFCLPVGTDRLIYTSCNKSDWKVTPCGGEYMVANDNAAVSAEYGVNDANSGYQMWWFKPNGGYSFKRFQSHLTVNGMPANATRACHFKLNAWAGNQLTEGGFYNVKVRGRINGVYNNWGPVCRMVVNSAEAQCPRTKLMDIPGNQYLSCGQTRTIGTNEYVHARPAKRMTNACAWQNANRYQFRFRIPAEFVTIVKTSAVGQYWVNTNGLTCGKTYEVDVRVSFDGGSNWCHSSDPYGEICLLTTTCSFGMAQEGAGGTAAEARMTIFPNPNRGDQVRLSLSSVEEGVETVRVDIYDATGVRVTSRTIAVQDGFVNTDLELNGALANGLYMVNVTAVRPDGTAGAATYNERLVIQR